MSQPQPFTIRVSDDVLDDLRARLARTRWPVELDGAEWGDGTSVSYLRELVDHWLQGFDWRAQERALNALPHYRAKVGEHDLHFIWEKGIGPRPIPIVLTHGWPSSFVEMRKIIPLLADPVRHGGRAEDAFDVVVPSLPGFGFSSAATKPGLSIYAVADLWFELMTGVLGYPRFAAQGGDWGAYLTARLGWKYGERLDGIHLSTVLGNVRPQLDPSSRPLDQEEMAFLERADRWNREEGGYEHLQGTRPQTPAFALDDSPVGLAAWIVEKFRAWSDCGGEVEKRFSKDELLTNITLYWVTQTIGPSMRLYRETLKSPWTLAAGERIETPTAVAVFPRDLNVPPRQWVERTFNVQQWTPFPAGGHFGAAEEPERLAEDIRSFFRARR